MGTYQHNTWIVNLVFKLLKGEKDVLSSLEYNPFPSKPPKYIKIDLYEYFLTNPLKERKTWYKRQFIRSYLPVISLRYALCK